MSDILNAILEQLQATLSPETFGTRAADLVTNVVSGLIVFGLYILLWYVIRALIKPLMRHSPFDKTSNVFIRSAIKYGILLMGIVSGLAAAGINTSALLASLGIAGFTIGFAAKDAFSNLISGFLIYLDRPFVIGDLVEIEGNYGTVDQITLRSTRIITSDGKMLAVPNADIINKTVASYTNFPHLRLDIEATVGVDEDLTQVRQVLLDQVVNDPSFLPEPAPRVVVTQLNDYNVAVELQAWLDNERHHVEQRAALRERVFNGLDAAGIEMPYETLRLLPIQLQN
ncbi:MAG: mechanosensitive ion channel family protein [Candidatus Promineifilaceae bacterium]|nr:mechanosensitive ion channel family protein [Candidatus Promineifilaceae bacterium]